MYHSVVSGWCSSDKGRPTFEIAMCNIYSGLNTLLDA